MTISPARSEKMTMNSSGRFPSVDSEHARRGGSEASADGLRADAHRPGEERERDDADDELRDGVDVSVVEDPEDDGRCERARDADPGLHVTPLRRSSARCQRSRLPIAD